MRGQINRGIQYEQCIAEGERYHRSKVTQPALRSSKGQPLLLFMADWLMNHTQVLPVISSVVQVEWISYLLPLRCILKVPPSLLPVNRDIQEEDEEEEEGESSDGTTMTAPLVLHLNVGETREILVTFAPQSAVQYKLLLLVQYCRIINFENTSVVMVRGVAMTDDTWLNRGPSCSLGRSLTLHSRQI